MQSDSYSFHRGVLFKRTPAVCCYLINAFKAISMWINKN